MRVGVLICYDNNIIEKRPHQLADGRAGPSLPHQTGGCDSLSPHGMKPIDVNLWHHRAADPAATLRLNCWGTREEDGSTAGFPRCGP